MNFLMLDCYFNLELEIGAFSWIIVILMTMYYQ